MRKPQRAGIGALKHHVLVEGGLELQFAVRRDDSFSRAGYRRLNDKSAAIGFQHAIIDGARGERHRDGRGSRFKDTASLIYELKAVGCAPKTGAADRGVEIGDDFGPAVREAECAVCRLGAEDDRAPATEDRTIGKSQVRQIA